MIFPTQPEPTSEPSPLLETDLDLDLSPPPSLRIPLCRSLIVNLLDRISPERLPPLELTSQPVDVGLLLGDMVEMPWFRTVFTNLGDVISGEITSPRLVKTVRNQGISTMSPSRSPTSTGCEVSSSGGSRSGEIRSSRLTMSDRHSGIRKLGGGERSRSRSVSSSGEGSLVGSGCVGKIIVD